MRFAGAFVLYNYARLATLINHHKQACDKGVCACVGGCVRGDTGTAVHNVAVH